MAPSRTTWPARATGRPPARSPSAGAAWCAALALALAPPATLTAHALVLAVQAGERPAQESAVAWQPEGRRRRGSRGASPDLLLAQQPAVVGRQARRGGRQGGQVLVQGQPRAAARQDDRARIPWQRPHSQAAPQRHRLTSPIPSHSHRRVCAGDDEVVQAGWTLSPKSISNQMTLKPPRSPPRRHSSRPRSSSSSG